MSSNGLAIIRASRDAVLQNTRQKLAAAEQRDLEKREREKQMLLAATSNSEERKGHAFELASEVATVLTELLKRTFKAESPLVTEPRLNADRDGAHCRILSPITLEFMAPKKPILYSFGVNKEMCVRTKPVLVILTYGTSTAKIGDTGAYGLERTRAVPSLSRKDCFQLDGDDNYYELDGSSLIPQAYGYAPDDFRRSLGKKLTDRFFLGELNELTA